MSTNDEIYEKGFDHPCRQTCSGWQQGRERGVFDTEKKLTKLRQACEGLLTYDPMVDHYKIKQWVEYHIKPALQELKP